MVGRRALGLIRRHIARPILHGLRRPAILRRIARASEIELLGHRLRTDPRVFHPVYFSSSRILAERVRERSRPGLRVLDVGTGSGVIAIAAAAGGASVTACDVNPDAVRLARDNAARNGLSVEVVLSNLFVALSGRIFDLIVFNIPFYPTEPATHLEAAFRAGRDHETVHRFAEGAHDHLSPDGRVMIVFSEDCDHPEIHRAFTERGFALEDERTTRSLLERFYVARFRKREAPSEPSTEA